MKTKKCTKCNRILPMDANHFKRLKRSKNGFNSQCKECTGGHFNVAVKEGYRICSSCKRELKLDEFHFMKQNDRKSGFRSNCKECMGYKFTERKPIAKEGYKICTKCGNELKATTEYFFKADDCQYGLMGYCKECAGYHYTPTVKDGYKRCSKCKTELPATIQYFTGWVNNKLYPSCRICNGGEYSPDEGYKKCSACGEVFPATKEFFSPNKECKYGVSPICKPCYRKYQRKWSKTEIARKISTRTRHIRKAREKELIANFTVEQWEECLKFFNYKDAYTGLEMTIATQDHVIPLTKGGIYSKSNIIPCEAKINASKGNHDMGIWYRRQEFFCEERLQKIYEWIGKIK